MKNLPTTLFLALLVCGSVYAQTPNIDEAYLNQLYLEAVEEAAIPTAAKQYDGLIAITPNNKALIRKTIDGQEYIRCVTWKGDASYFPKPGEPYNTGKWPNIWITASPQLKARFNVDAPSDTNLYLLQLLGLPPNSVYKSFVELWVSPDDLMRPCPDKEITDTECNLCFSKQDSIDTAWVDWISDSRISRFYACDPLTKYPWTQLGYTYDWNPKNPTHHGLSEFVIKKNANVYIAEISSTRAYLNRKD